MFELVKNPRPFPWALAFSVSGIGGGVLIAWRHRTRSHSAMTTKELQLQLLGRLELSGHGAIGSLSSLRRFIWHLDTVIQGFTPDEQMMETLNELSDDILEVGLPNLLATIELAEIVKMDGDLIRGTQQSITRLQRLLERLSKNDFSVEAIQNDKNELQELATDSEQKFNDLRKIISSNFCSNPHTVFERSLTAHADAIAKNNIEVSLAEDEAPDCTIDNDELAFILDNLVENGIRAMQASPIRKLSLGWIASEDHVIITVKDSGCGISPDECDLIMEPGNSKRKGGGLGLPRSKEILRKYGAHLGIKESDPGHGTTMALTVPRADR